MKKILAIILSITTLGAQSPPESHIIVHENATVDVATTADWVGRTQFVALGTGSATSAVNVLEVVVPGTSTPDQIKLASLTTVVTTLQERLAALTTTQDEHTVSLESLATLTTSLQGELATLQTLVATQGVASVDGIAHLQGQVTVLEGLLGSTNVTTLVGTLTILSEQVAQLQINMTDVQTSLESVLSASSMSSVVTALSESVDLLNGAIAQMSVDVSGLQGSVKDLLDGPFTVPLTPITTSTSVDTLVTQVADYITQMQGKANLLEVRIQEMEALVANLPLMHVQSDSSGLDALTQFSVASALTRSPFAGIELRQTVRYAYSEMLDVDRNLLIDGNHESIVFSNVPTAQLTVRAGKTLRLQNITLQNIHAGTIAIEGAQLDASGAVIVGAGTIECGPNVRWELHDDVTLQSGNLVLNQHSNVMHISGVGGVRTLDLRGDAACVVGRNTLALHNITLSGADRVLGDTALQPHAQTGIDQTLVGALGLCGHAHVRVAQRLQVGLMVVGVDNSLWCQSRSTDLVSIERSIMFAPDGRNELSWTIAHQPNYAAGCLLSQDALLIDSTYGSAHLSLETPDVVWHLLDADAVYVGPGGAINGTNIHLNGAPLKVAPARTQPVFSQTTHVSGGVDMHNVVTRAATGPTRPHITTLHAARAHLIPSLSPAVGVGTHDVYTGQVALTRMSGTVVVDGGTIERWALEPIGDPGVGSAALTLRDGACLIQGEATTIKSIDSITVSGAGNRIVVTDLLDWHGSLRCEKGSELTIECRRGGRVVCDATNWTFGQGAHICIEGPGELALTNAINMTLNGTRQQPVTMQYTNGVQVQVASGAVWQMSGIGAVTFDSEAHCALAPNAKWLCGRAQTDADSLCFTFDRHAQVVLGYDANTCQTGSVQPARWSLGYGSFKIKCNRGAGIDIAPAGILECNLRSGAVAKGWIDELAFYSGGYLRIEGDFLMGTPRASSMIEWRENGGGIYGPGQVGTLGSGLPCVRSALPTACRQGAVNTTQFRQTLTT